MIVELMLLPPFSPVARCPSLSNPSNGQVEVTGSVAVYECESGYRLDGENQRLCDNNTAQWLGAAPQCTRMYNTAAI